MPDADEPAAPSRTVPPISPLGTRPPPGTGAPPTADPLTADPSYVIPGDSTTTPESTVRTEVTAESPAPSYTPPPPPPDGSEFWRRPDGPPDRTTDIPKSPSAAQSARRSEPASTSDGRRSGSGGRRFFAGVVVGALVGGLAGGGVATIIDDDQPDPIASTATPVADPAPSRPLGDNPSVSEVVEAVGPSVVTVRTTTPGFFGGNQGAGSGFIISADGVVVSNNHVVAGASNVTVVLAGGEEHRADVLTTDPSRDLAVLKIDAIGLPAVTLGSSAELRAGNQVIAIGNALDLGSELTVTDGIVSALNREIRVDANTSLEGLIQTDAAINPGNSGGPLLNAAGEVVGINTAVAGGAENIGFAVAIDSIRETIEAVRDGDIPTIAFLGVQTLTVDDELQQRFGLAVDEGALVAEVTAGTAADDAGLQAGDVITAIDGESIASSEELGDAIGTREGGEEITITLSRNGRAQELTAVLGQRATVSG